MKKLLAAAALLSCAVALFMIAQSTAPGATALAAAAPTSDTAAREAVRGMAQYLAASPAALAAAAGGPNRAAPGVSPVVSPCVSTDTPAEAAAHAAEAGALILEGTEREIAPHYSVTESGSLLRRFVALQLAGNSENSDDAESNLNRESTLGSLMMDPITAAADVQAALAAIPADAENERAALLSLAPRFAADGRTRAAAVSVVTAEMNRVSTLDAEANVARLTRLADAYAAFESDPAKQADLLRASIQSQSDAVVRAALQAKLDSLSQVELAGA